MRQKQTPWYLSIGTILLLLLSPIALITYIIGLILMWRYTAWPKAIKIIATVIFFPLFSFLFVYIFLFRPFQIGGRGMEPNYHNQEYVLTSIVNERIRAPQRGDVVILHAPTDPEKDFIKRVIGLPGETISLHDGDVFINNQRLDERAYETGNVLTNRGTFLRDGTATIIPTNYYFVLGDNRSNSSDSREWGFVNKNAIMSKVLFCYFNCPK